MEYQAPLRDMQFLLRDVFDIETMWQKLPALAERVDIDTAEAILEEAGKLASGVVAPLNREGDEEGARWEAGKVSTPKGFREAFSTFAQGGWIGLGGNPEYGGMGMPKSLAVLFEEMMMAANASFTLYPSLTAGACLALDAHGEEGLKAQYLPKLYSGEWSGTMCLTEPHSGTDLGIIKSRAVPNPDGSYQITGTKIFITGGDHDLSDNIIHFVLAKLPDAPKGPKGISLFLVPKFLPDADNCPGDANGVTCGSIEKKMGIKASATCVMNFDDAKGWLVGEVNRGLNAMFTMMNFERLSIGLQGLGAGEMAYQAAVAYARDRIQGRAATGPVQPDKAADPIIVHPDVRRMLLNIRSLTEAGRAFAIYTATFLDIGKYAETAEERAAAERRVALLTPVAKAFFTDMGLNNCIDGQQVFGGHGFIREWGMEQLVRDVRISQIYEGTNGIQALDLMGRKVVADGGKALGEFIAEARDAAGQMQGGKADAFASATLEAMQVLEDVSQQVLSGVRENPNAIGAASVEFLHLFGYAAYAYMWMLMVQAAGDDEFGKVKRLVGDYYLARMLPRIHGLKASIVAGPDSLMALGAEHF